MRRWSIVLATSMALGCAALVSCDDENGSTGDAGLSDGPRGGDAWLGNQPTCSGTVYACSDGKDNDDDGLVDAQDPECIGPCDDDEGTFATGIPGDNVDACKQDCFFDGNSGAGDDKCDWDLRCDPASPGGELAKSCPYDPDYKNCPETQSAACIENCRGLTPNGCDCFGCCQVFSDGKEFLIYLGSGPDCTAATPDKCATCTQVEDCDNDCGECELCLGKTIDDLPAKCFPDDPDAGTPKLPTCSDERTPCLDNAGCPENFWCLTGCCTPTIQ